MSSDATFPLSSTQQAVWLDQLLAPDLPCYNVGGGLYFNGEIRLDLWERVIAQVVHDNDALRIILVDQLPLAGQKVLDQVDFKLVCHDYSAKADGEQQAWAHIERTFAVAFPLYGGLLWEIQWIQVTPRRGCFLFRFHHLIADGTSISLIGNAVVEAYNRLLRGEPANVANDLAGPSYLDFVASDLRYLESPRYEKDREFWFSRLARAPDALFDRGGREVARHRCEQVIWTIARDDHDRWVDSVARMGYSSTHMLIAVLALYFSRTSGERSAIVVGTPVHNRRNAAEKRTVGMFASVLPLIVPVDPDAGFADTLRAVAAESKACYRHQRFPLYEINRQLQKNPLQRSRLFDLTVSVENFPGDLSTEVGHMVVASHHNGFEAVALALYLRNYEKSRDVRVEFNFDPAVLSRAEVETAVIRIERLLRAALEMPDMPQWQLPLLDAAERRQVVHGFNATRAELGGEGLCIHELIERQAARTPQALAVEDEDGRAMNYGELNARANQIARHLVASGVRPDDRVAVALPRGGDLSIALLAIFKAGGAYVPLDLDYPVERLTFMLEDSAPRVLLTRSGALAGMRQELANPPRVVEIDTVEGSWLAHSEHNLSTAELGLHNRHLAYLIYTSGSTGRPKGVMIEHRSLVNYTLDAARWFGLGPGERVLQQNSLNFDLSLEEMLPALAAGATLVASNTPLGVDGAELNVSMVHLTAAHWHTLVSQWALEPQRARQRLAKVRLINVTGEALSVARLGQWDALRPEHIGLINTYGPTEATISCSALMARHDLGLTRVSIGRPFANTRMYILDGHAQPVPVGVPGEIHIGGIGVARGYLNLPELSAERFVPDPFSAENGCNEEGARMYKSGDLGLWRSDGSIEFLGRRDHQVKVRGFRIELEEIEARLLEQPGVREAVVLALEDASGAKRLVAYHTGEEIDAAVLREHLAHTLPEFMVPAAYVRLDALPLSPNGKLDRSSLAPPGQDAFGARAYEPPQGPVENALAEIWCRLLGVERVGRQDNFFDLGGHSLLAVQMVQAARQVGIPRNVSHIFRVPTLAAFAADEPESGEGGAHAVAIRREGTERPLFVMHMPSGEVSFAYRLERHIVRGIPIYGLPAPREETPIDSLKTAAATVVGMLKAVQPAGPYRLLGWSFGGTLGYEVAAQLLAAGDSIEFLGLVDTPQMPVMPPTRSLDEEIADIDGWMAELVKGPEELATARALLSGLPPDASWEDRFSALRLNAKTLFNVVAAPVAHMLPDEARHWLIHWRARGRAGAAYVRRTLPLSIDLFTTEEMTQAFGPWLGWDELYPPDRIRVTPVQGTHALVMNEPNIASVGAAISTVMRAPMQPSCI